MTSVIGQEHRPPAEDQRVAEEEEDDPGNAEEDDADVEARDEVVDPGDSFARTRGWIAGGCVRRPSNMRVPSASAGSGGHSAVGDDREAEGDGSYWTSPRAASSDQVSTMSSPIASGQRRRAKVARQ